MEARNYLSIVSQCESYLADHGDTHLGVGWPKAKDVDTRYQVMLDIVRADMPGKATLLDFGCGASHLYDYMLRRGLEDRIEYSGLDLSEKFISLSRGKHPAIRYYRLDILNDHADLPSFDYVVMNGVFTQKCDLSFDEMWEYLRAVVSRVFTKAQIGIAFNVMSKQVDWERDDLFHLPFDMLASWLTQSVSRHFAVRHDYGLFEYTVYVYSEPNVQVETVARRAGRHGGAG